MLRIQMVNEIQGERGEAIRGVEGGHRRVTKIVIKNNTRLFAKYCSWYR